MTKTQELATAFLQKTPKSRPVMLPAVNIVNAFQSLFAVQELNERESKCIERILVEGVEPEQSMYDINADIVEVKRLTKELLAIKRQEIILIGERIAQVRTVFHRYRERSFREWLELTFGSFKTGYNYLSFYDLYLSVPEEIKLRLKEMPAKAVYVLATQKVSVDRKVEIIKDYANETAQDLIDRIRKHLGPSYVTKRPSNEYLIRQMERDAAMLVKDDLTEAQRLRLKSLVVHLRIVIEVAPL
jgi:hypothetical protein